MPDTPTLAMPGLVRPDDEGAKSADDPQHLHRQRREYRIARDHHQRHPAHDSVDVGIHRQDAAAGRCLVQERNVLQQIGIAQHVGARVAAQCRQRRALHLRVAASQVAVIARLAKHHASGPPQRIREHRVVAGQLFQLGQRVRIQPVDVGGEVLRRGPVLLGEDDIDTDHQRVGLDDVLDQPGDERARPRPLAVSGEGFLVDIDDPCRARRVQVR